jgi:DNA-binding response OmpR family regulator
LSGWHAFTRRSLPAAEFLEKPIDFKVVLAKVSAILAAPSARPIADNQP